MAAPSPFFYRIRQADSSAFPPYAPATNIASSMLADEAVQERNLDLQAVTREKIADGAVNSAKIDSSTVQRRVTGSAAVGSFIRAINADGSVTVGTPNQAIQIKQSNA